MQKISLKNIIVGVFLAVVMYFPLESHAASRTFTTNGTFTVPAGVTQIFVTAAAGGGGGGMGAGGTGGGGGSGDAILNKAFTVVPGNSYAITVGVGGAGGIGGQTNAAGDGKPGTATSMTGLFTLNGGTADIVWGNPWVLNYGCGRAGGPGGTNGEMSYSMNADKGAHCLMGACWYNATKTYGGCTKSGNGGSNIAGGVGGLGGTTNCPSGGCGAATTGQPGGSGVNGGGGGSGGHTSTSHPASGGKGGNGFVQITYPDTIPTVTFWADSPSISAGTSTNLHWSAPEATFCTASGSWSGAKAASGAESTGILSATQVYFLTCSNAIGTSPLYTVPLTVIPVIPSTLKVCLNSCNSGSNDFNGQTISLAPGETRKLATCYNTASGCTDASGDITALGTTSLSATDAPGNAVTPTATKGEFSGNAVASVTSETVSIASANGNASLTLRVAPICASSCSAEAADHCQGETFTTTDSCGASESCTGTRYCDFNWKEVAP